MANTTTVIGTALSVVGLFVAAASIPVTGPIGAAAAAGFAIAIGSTATSVVGVGSAAYSVLTSPATVRGLSGSDDITITLRGRVQRGVLPDGREVILGAEALVLDVSGDSRRPSTYPVTADQLDVGELSASGSPLTPAQPAERQPVVRAALSERWTATTAMSAMNGMLYAVDNDRLFRASPDDGTTVQLYPRLRPPTSGATGWIEPSGVPLLTGVREMAAGHGSIYLLRDRDGNGAGEAQSSVRWIDRLSAGGSRSGFIPPMGDGVAPWELPDLNPDFHPPFPILTGSSDWSSPQLSERAAGLVCAALSTVVFDRGAAICITPVGEAFTLTPLGPPSEEFRSAVTATETGLLMELGGLLVMWPEVAAMATQPTSAVAVDFVGATGEHLVVEALVYVRPHAFALVAPRGGFGQSLWRVTVDDESFADPGAAQVEPLELFRWLPSTTVRHLTSIRGSVFTIEDSLLEVGRLMRTTARPDVEADIDPIVERLWWTTMGGRRGSLRRWRLAAQPGQLVGRDHQFRADAPVCSIARHE